MVARASGLSRPTIHKGLRELREAPLPAGQVRRPGAGRKRVQDAEPALLERIEQLIDPATRGDPMSALRWTSKSTRHLAQVLNKEGYDLSHETVAHLLHGLGYSLQANAKMLEGAQHPDRNERRCPADSCRLGVAVVLLAYAALLLRSTLVVDGFLPSATLSTHRSR
jgi:transposase